MEHVKIIARIHSDFKEKFGIPRQSGLVAEAKASIVFESEYRNQAAVKGLEGFSHIWLIWGFSEAEREVWSPTVRPPRLGGNQRIGVFATRSPYRPNALGLSSVQLEQIEFSDSEGPVLHIAGADLLDGTPIYDIKPYLAYTDSHPEATSGFAGEPAMQVKVEITKQQLSQIPEAKRSALLALLENDPRPQYHNDPKRIYGMRFAEYEVKFRVADAVLTVEEITEVPI